MSTDKRLILHVGPGKTGTTALQRSLAKHADFLNQRDYAAITLQYDFKEMMAYFTPRKSGLKPADIDPAGMRQLFEQTINAVPQKNVIVSSEYMAGPMTNSQTQAIDKTRYLTEAYDNIVIVFYIRRQDNMYESIFQQQYKKGQVENFAAFCEKYDVAGLDFSKRLMMFEQAFPKAQIIVRPYEFTVSEVDILRDFLNSLGVSDLPENVASNRSNLSFTEVGMHLLNFCHEHMDEQTSDSLRSLMISRYRQTNKVSDKGYGYFDPERRVEVVNAHCGSNRLIFQRYKVGDEEEFQRWNSFYENLPSADDSGMAAEPLDVRATRYLIDSLLTASAQQSR